MCLLVNDSNKSWQGILCVWGVCNNFSIARTCCPGKTILYAWQEFNTDGLMALTATALRKALTVHLSLTLSLLFLQPCSNFMHQSPTAVSPCLHLCCPGIFWDSKSLSLHSPLSILLLDIQLWEENEVLATLVKSEWWQMNVINILEYESVSTPTLRVVLLVFKHSFKT